MQDSLNLATYFFAICEEAVGYCLPYCIFYFYKNIAIYINIVGDKLQVACTLNLFL